MKRTDAYHRYMHSAAWRRRRQRALDRAEGRCEHCKRPSTRLEVHHLHYDNFGHERLEDLLVVCLRCHPHLDRQRKRRILRKAINTYMTKRFGRNWERDFTWRQATRWFRAWLKG